MNLLVITLHLRWSTMAVAIGAIIATGGGATMIAVGGNTMTKAVVDADIRVAQRYLQRGTAMRQRRRLPA